MKALVVVEDALFARVSTTCRAYSSGQGTLPHSQELRQSVAGSLCTPWLAGWLPHLQMPKADGGDGELHWPFL